MKLTLVRNVITEKSAKGVLYIDGDFICYTLEDPPRDEKIPGITGIPEGEYPVVLNWSPRFKKILPLVLNVKGFSGVRIHSGNKPEDTEGCILVGDSWTNDYLFNSRKAFNALMTKLKTADEITLEIMREV